jgi:hypothetical protein
MSNENCECAFCKPKKMDWQDEAGFYGYKCGTCNQATAFIVRSEHKGALNNEEKKIVEKLCEKYYPNLKIKWISNSRRSITHWWDFLVPK